MQRIGFFLSDDDIKYLDDYKAKKELSSRNKALTSLINEHKKDSYMAIENIYEFMSKQIAQELNEELKNVIADKVVSVLKPQMNSIKFACNSINKSIKIVLELINGIYYKESYEIIPSIEDVPTVAYNMSKEVVEEQIIKSKKIKSNSLD